MKMKKIAAIGVLAAGLIAPFFVRAQQQQQSQPLYLDPSQPIDKRVDDLIQRLTPDEKTSLLSTTAPAIDRLKIPAMDGWNQSLHGIVWTKPTTMFPVPISMAATWDPALTQEVAGAIADEGRAIYNYWHTVSGTVEAGGGTRPAVTVLADGTRVAHNGLVYRSPVVNMDRDPRWGRIWEAFGEDPLLASKTTVAYVKGTQGDGKYMKLAATLKHYAVYNQEVDRTSTSTDLVSERMLREYFLPQFKAGIMAGHAASIMSSYNGINGMPNAENKFLLTDILRDEWHFDGFVVPDSGAVRNLVTAHKKYPTLEEAAAKTVLAGSDLDDGTYAQVLSKAVSEGLLTEHDIDQSLRRVLNIRFRLGEFDPPDVVPYSKLGPDVIDSQVHRQLALRQAQESIVLLRNNNNFLPLDKTKIKTLAVIGPFADFAQTGPNYTGLYSKFVKPLEGIQNKVGPGVKVLYARGSGILESDDPKASDEQAAAIAKQADAAILFVGSNEVLEREGIDRLNIGLPPVQAELVRTVLQANPKTVVVLLNGGPVAVAMGGFGRGGAAAAGGRGGRGGGVEIPAMLDMFWAGEEGGTAVADVLFGDYNPGGRLPYTVYPGTQGLPPMTDYDITRGFTYMYYDGRPEFAFGHGLSYTTFDYSNLHLSANQVPGDGKATVSVDVRNSGQRAGDEVVQLYVHDDVTSVKRPKEQLQGFQRINLKAGESKTVTFTIPIEQLSYWDTTRGVWVVEPGTFHFMVGSGSDDIRQKADVQVTSAGEWPPSDLTTEEALKY
ncbi:MAG TPA: glycoside hydrolase family 3 C-terminal domain-containing protein [Candidatus Acidoferrales bacterium]